MLVDVRTLGERLTLLFEEAQRRAKAEGRTLDGADINRMLGKKAMSGYFSRLKRGQRETNPDPDAVKKLADYFGVSFDWLYWGRGPREPQAAMPTAEAELLRASVSGRPPFAPGAGPDNIDAVMLFYPGKYAPAFVGRVRAATKAEGVEPNSKSPAEWDLELESRWLAEREELEKKRGEIEARRKRFAEKLAERTAPTETDEQKRRKKPAV